MKVFKGLLFLLFLAFILWAVLYYFKERTANESFTENPVTSQKIIDEVLEKYSLAEKTLFWNGETASAISGSPDKLAVRGTVRIDLGIDLDYFSANDIVIDHINKNIVVYLPPAEIRNLSIKDEFAVKDSSGAWVGAGEFFPLEKETLRGEAAEGLIASAEKYVFEQKDIFAEAYESGASFTRFLLETKLPGYRLEINAK